jgi:hypothetical protein
MVRLPYKNKVHVLGKAFGALCGLSLLTLTPLSNQGKGQSYCFQTWPPFFLQSAWVVLQTAGFTLL